MFFLFFYLNKRIKARLPFGFKGVKRYERKEEEEEVNYDVRTENQQRDSCDVAVGASMKTAAYLIETHDVLRRTAGEDGGEDGFLQITMEEI